MALQTPPLPPQLEQHLVRQCLGEDAAEKLRSGKLPHAILQPIVDAVMRLSAHYTSDRESLPDQNIQAIESAAYALYFTPVNYVKIRFLLGQLSDLKDRTSPLNVLDYGCGPGTASLALLDAVSAPLQITLSDRSEAMRIRAEQLVKSYKGQSSLNSIDTLPDLPTIEHKFDLIMMAHVLNELDEVRSLALLKEIVQRLSDGGVIIIVDTALKDQTRILMKLRDQLLSHDSSLAVLYPCTHRKPCPMLVHSTQDWCHGTVNWQPPALIRQIDEMSGFNKHRLKLSALIVQRAEQLNGGFRTVTIPESNKIQASAILCGESYYGEAILRKRDRSDSNRPFLRLDQWERCEITEAETLPLISKSAVVSCKK